MTTHTDVRDAEALQVATGRAIGVWGSRLIRAASWAIALAPAGSGQGVIAQPLYRRALAGRPPHEMIARLRGGVRLSLDLSDRIQAEALLTRNYDPPLQRFIDR